VAEQKLLRELLETHERLTGSRVAVATAIRSAPRRLLPDHASLAAVVAPSVEIEAEPVAQAG